MKTRAALLRELPGNFEIEEVELESPRTGEVMVKLAASGMCHSDLSIARGTHPSGHLPMIGGHEGAGTIVEVGPSTPGWEEGQPVLLSCLPQCGRCRWCLSGHGNMCELAANMPYGSRYEDSTSFRVKTSDGVDAGQWTAIGTFSEYSTVSVNQVVPVPDGVPLATVPVIACGVASGWGSAVHLAAVRPGDTVVVMGVGGVGNYAVQGALHAGAENVIAVDPLEFKRQMAADVGATHTCESMEEATELARTLTEGDGANSAIVTVGILRPEYLLQAFAAVGKLGTVVATALNEASDLNTQIDLWDFTINQKRLQGGLLGGCTPMIDLPLLLNLYKSGKLKLDQTVSSDYGLDDIDRAWSDLEHGRTVRNVMVFD